MEQAWPQRLWVVRHGESAGNVARDAAHLAGGTVIDIAGRDVDVPLSALGEEQAEALAQWFAALPQESRPNVIVSSPYLRARRTAEAVAKAGLAESGLTIFVDERLREKEFGILDRLTRLGIEQMHPEQASIRRTLGKFYHRPPGGESWCDVILRLRSALNTLSLHLAGRRVLIVAHEVVIMCFRYLLEELDEATLMAIGARSDCANCGITDYVYAPRPGGKGGSLQLRQFNFTVPLEREGTPVTSAPDASVGAK